MVQILKELHERLSIVIIDESFDYSDNFRLPLRTFTIAGNSTSF